MSTPPESTAERPLTRKERKRLAARLHAASCGTFADAVVSSDPGAAPGENRFLAPLAISYPIAALPLDIFENVLLFFLDYASIKALMRAAPGVDLLMRTRDDLWERLMIEGGYHRLFESRIASLRHSREYAAAGPRRKIEILVRERQTGEDAIKAAAEASRQRQLNSPGSEMIRRTFREATAKWAGQQVTAFMHQQQHDDVQLKRPFVVHKYWRDLAMTYPDYNYVEISTDKAIAGAKHIKCEHRNVCMVRAGHCFYCLDCDLTTHALKVPRDVVTLDEVPVPERLKGLKVSKYP